VAMHRLDAEYRAQKAAEDTMAPAPASAQKHM